jgi:hypothetical protein
MNASSEKSFNFLKSGHARLGQSVGANVQIVPLSHAGDTLNYFANFALNTRDQYLGSDVKSEKQKYRFQVKELATNRI